MIGRTRFLLASTALLSLLVSAWGQTTTGQISGSVVDSSGQIVVGARVTLRNEGTGDARQATTNTSGDFVFPTLVPSTYAIRVENPGFTAAERTGIVLTANERRALGNIELAVGAVSESVSVRADNVLVQTTSSENSELLSTKQLDQLSSKGRDVVALLRVMPGVSAGTDNAALGDTYGTSTPNIGGTRNRMNTFTLDGQTGSDADLVDRFNGATSMDAIAEVKVLMNNYQAEYGRNAGAFVNIVSKSGTRDFHGSLYWFKRHEQFNANDFFNNLRGQAKPLYRYNTFGGTIGGPVYIPKVFNTNKDKLFFFYSREDWRIFEPRNPRTVTVPTALERAGDFSQSVDVNNRLITVRDPQTNQPFPGNRVPPNRINPNGQAILNLFPQPNFFDRAISGGNYNYVFQEITEHPKRQNMLKMDYNPTDNDRISFRGRTWWADRRGYEGLAAFNSNWNQLHHHYLFTEDSVMASYTRVFSPTIINEFNASYRVLGEIGDATSPTNFDPVIREKVGLGGLGQLYPANNPLGIIPQASFGGVPSAANIAYDDRLPIAAGDERYILLDNISITRGSHAMKFGFYYEKNYASEGPRTLFGGNFAFARDVNNPLDTNYAYSNAALGVFQTYSEGSARTTARNVIDLFEWFAQDSWKVNRRLTLDYGLRFSRATPYRFPDRDAAAFVLDRYNPANAPQLFQPVRNAQGQRVGQNPVTGEQVPAVMIGAYVPGTGDPFNGMATAADPQYANGFTRQQPIQLGPRFGFAWDVFGDNKTALRGGFGVTKNMIPSSGLISGAANSNPPNQIRPQLFYGTMDSFLNSSGVLFPPNVVAFEWDQKIPTVYSWTFGLQRDLGASMVLDVAYVGNVARYLSQQRDLNTLPYGTRFLPGSADPSNPSTPLQDNFLRLYPGYGSLNYREYSGISNYNALQTSVNRRFMQGLQFGVSYTWSKAMDYTSGDNGGLPIFRSYRQWSYGEAAFDQTHVAVINYIWDLPRLSRLIPNGFVKAVFDNWQFSGITTLASGTPLGMGLSTTDNIDFTGGGDGTRVDLLGPVNLSSGERSFDRWFATENIARPEKGVVGNAPKNVFRGPGIHNWDITAFKNIPLRGENGPTLQLRWEIYNVFNHTQYEGVNTAARFDPAGNQVNATLGQITSTRPPRQMQGSLRFVF
jgi:Carboxypeptidase regulatory-like domain/TonB-dependent Receptor Plug Domain